METTTSYSRDSLHLEVSESEREITLTFLGKSLLREPNEFVMPIFLDLLSKTADGAKRIVMDFTRLSYMNSSTLTPIIRILERARLGRFRISILYNKALKWQDISFSALTLFQTEDRRIEIRGVE